MTAVMEKGWQMSLLVDFDGKLLYQVELIVLLCSDRNRVQKFPEDAKARKQWMAVVSRQVASINSVQVCHWHFPERPYYYHYSSVSRVEDSIGHVKGLAGQNRLYSTYTLVPCSAHCLFWFCLPQTTSQVFHFQYLNIALCHLLFSIAQTSCLLCNYAVCIIKR